VKRTVSILFALFLAFSLCLVMALPVMAQTANFVPNTGPVGTTTAVTGAAWAVGENITAVTVGGVAAAHTLTVDGAGNLSGNITIPAQGAGAKDVVITGDVSGAQTFAGAFTVTVATANFVPASGPVGTTTAVTGAGWVAGDTIAVGAVTVGGVVAIHTLTVDGGGNLSGNITIPAQAAGAKDVVITGTTSGAQTFASAFTVTTVTASFIPSSAPAGTVIAVTGAGWAVSDTITGVTVGGVGATQTLVVNAAGALSGNITIPAQAAGVKNVVITGAASGAQTFTGAFTVTVFGGGGGGVAPSSASGVGSLSLTPYLNWQGKATANISLTSNDSLVTMNIPLGTEALDAQGDPLGRIEIDMLSTPPPPTGYVLVGHAYDCLPDGATFQPFMTLTFEYAQADVPEEVNELDLVLAYWDGEEWINLSTTVNAAANTATANVAHFTPFAILAYVGTPEFGTSDLAINPVEVNIGEEVTIGLLVANTGDLAGSYEVTLEIGNVAVATEVVNLAAGASEGVNFTTTGDVAGTYTVSVGGLSGTLVVKPAPAAFSLSNLSIQPAEVKSGEAVTITVSVLNTGGAEGSYTLVLKIDGVEEANKIVTVAPGSDHDVALTVTKEKAGIYSVSVGGLSGSFTVTSALNIWLIIGIIVAIIVVVSVAVILGRGSRGKRRA
jgi:hypothetical protein